jgi:hypothetical protein
LKIGLLQRKKKENKKRLIDLQGKRNLGNNKKMLKLNKKRTKLETKAMNRPIMNDFHYIMGIINFLLLNKHLGFYNPI